MNKGITDKPTRNKKQIARNKNLTADSKLTPKQKIFCQKYIELNNGTQAAIAAGYSEKNAKVVACENLTKPNVAAEIQRLQAEVKNSNIASAQEVMEYFTRVMNGEEKDQFGLDAPLSERTKAATELARRTVDLENRMQGKADATVEIKLDWSR